MTDDKEKQKKSYFTEKEQEAMTNLPVKEQEAFYHRLGDITMRIRIADDAWNKTKDEIDDKINTLFDEIHARLARFEKEGK